MNALLLIAALQVQVSVPAVSESALEWAGRFWAADSVKSRDEVATDWLATEPQFAEVKAALETGRRYPEEAPTGYLLRTRTNAEGVEFPYLILVPEDYTPERRWRVRLNLHGGMGAPPWKLEGAEWAGGWNRVRGEIMVHPAGWIDEMWWHRSQVENFEAILREVRATWNTDENRVVATGNSDGSAALFFLAMRTPNRFASYAGHVGPPDRLTRAEFEPDGQMHPGNMRDQSFLLGYGEKDRLVPIEHIRRYMALFQSFGADLDWYSLPDKAHSLDLSDERVREFLQFIDDSRRDPLPDKLSWSTEDVERYGRRSWLRIDRLAEFARREKADESGILPRWGTRIQMRGKTMPRVPFGTVELTRTGNRIDITSGNVREITLLLSTDEFDFTREVQAYVDGEQVLAGVPDPSCEVLLHWAARDDDRTMLFGATWSVELGKE